MNYITNVEAGSGLIKYGSALVPFVNRFPKDTKLYQLMTTRPGEGGSPVSPDRRLRHCRKSKQGKIRERQF